MKYLITDELSMVSSALLKDIYLRLWEAFMMISKKASVGLSVMTVANFP